MQTLHEELSEIDRLGVEGSQQNAVETEEAQRIDRQLKAWLKHRKTEDSKEEQIQK